ncbi:MAG: sugar ABC transporter permease [Actinobacteria bacterium]|nr:sugar ABC transporter permease [Actinomycetota bacterium]
MNSIKENKFWLSKLLNNENTKAYTYLGLAIIFFLVFLLYPLIFSLILSFHEWSGFSQNPFEEFVGLSHYVKMFQDKIFYTSLKNTTMFAFVILIGQNVVGLSLALFLFYGKIRGSVLWRSIIFFPTLLSSVIVGLVWRRIFMGDGLLNIIWQNFHPESEGFLYLSNRITPIFVVMLVNIWQWSGYNMVLYYAGLQGVDNELVEAAKIDGATWLQTIKSVVIPQLSRTISLCIILNIIGSFKGFDLIYIITGGGPDHSSEVLASQIYYESFSMFGPNRMGYASAIAVVLTIIVVVFAIIRIRIDRRFE